MEVSSLEWGITIAVTVAVLLFDVVMIARDPHEPSLKECATALSVYIGAAVIFGAWIWIDHGHDYGVQFYAGWLTEYSLSIDNLFVFIILMASLKVPRHLQQEALMVGIILALIFRGIFIALGYQLIANFSWVFYVFGAFLVYTAYSLVKSYRSDDDGHSEENKIVAFAQRRLNVSDNYHGLKLFFIENGARVVSPMLIVIIALGTTDLLFALDSIPAIYGLTEEPYIVFTANAFALMGLRQLYFLIGGLLDRLVYLSIGLSIILGFIGLKLMLHALHKNTLPFINGGQYVDVPEISTGLSISVIGVVLLITTVASLIRTRGRAANK